MIFPLCVSDKFLLPLGSCSSSLYQGLLSSAGSEEQEVAGVGWGRASFSCLCHSRQMSGRASSPMLTSFFFTLCFQRFCSAYRRKRGKNRPTKYGLPKVLHLHRSYIPRFQDILKQYHQKSLLYYMTLFRGMFPIRTIEFIARQ